MTAGDKFNLCVNEFTESNNLKLQSETSSTDATVIPVIDDKIDYIQFTAMALWSTLAFCSSIQSKIIYFSKDENVIFF